MIFKSSEQLIERVKESLHSYQASGQLDQGLFYRWIKEILAKLNVPAYSVAHKILDIEDGKVLIPDDVYQIWALYRYEETSEKVRTYYKEETTTRRIEGTTCYDQCSDPCDIQKECDSLIVTKETTDHFQTRTYSDGALLSLKNYKLERCDSESPSIHNKSSLEATMDNNYFYFNFDSGSIYLQYFRMMMEDGLPMIPDVVQIEQAIEYYIMYKFVQSLYINGEGDAIQRMQILQQEYNFHYGVARSWVKLPTARSLIEHGKLLRNKYKIFDV